MAIVETIQYNREAPEPAVVDRVAEHIFLGGLAVVPTDTVYGILGDATADPAAEAIFQMKNRSREQALPVFVDNPESLHRWYIRFPQTYLPLVETYWPGPLTVVLPVWPGFYLRVGGTGKSVGVRATPEPFVRALMRKTNRYLLATSANPSESTLAQDEMISWLEQAPGDRIQFLKSDGYLPGTPSSVIDLTGDHPCLARSGAVSAEELKKLLPDLEVLV